MLAKRLAEARKLAGLTQIDLAVALGENHTQQMISLVERGHRGLSHEDIATIAIELNVSTDYLLGLSDDPTPAADRIAREAALKQDHATVEPKAPSNAVPALTEAQVQASAIAQDLHDPLLEGWLLSGEALLELQRRPATRIAPAAHQT